MIVHIEKRNIATRLVLNRNSDDGFCHRTSNAIDLQNGGKGKTILRKSVM